MHNRGTASRAAIVALLAAAAGPAAAAATPDGALPRWEWGVGIGAAWLRDYPGSTHESAYALPYPWFVWRSGHAEIGREGARSALYRSAATAIDFTLTANPPSRDKDNPERAGMPALDAVVEPGLRGRWRVPLDDAGQWQLDFRLPVRMAYTFDERLRSDALGVHAEPGIALTHRVAPGWSWSLSAAAGFAESDCNDYYYGVPATESTPTRPAYHARGGYTGWQAGGRVAWQRRDFSGGAFLRVENVGGAVFSDSPLVSTPWGYTVGFNLSWRIGQSRRTVNDDES